MKKKIQLYPCVKEAEAQKGKRRYESDFIGGAPNYEKFKGWTAEEVLVWLNVD